MSKATPGPWEATGRNYRYIVNFEEDTESQDELQAIGHLLAASPELLAEVKRLRARIVALCEYPVTRFIQNECLKDSHLEETDALIAKAEGNA